MGKASKAMALILEFAEAFANGAAAKRPAATLTVVRRRKSRRRRPSFVFINSSIRRHRFRFKA
jgi:hypothetical protein